MSEPNINENNAASQTWNKFCTTAKKAGFREGVTEGRNQTFQKSFDEGYSQGFSTGFALGKCKGILCTSCDNNSSTHGKVDTYLEKCRRGLCQMCQNEALIFSSINEIKGMHDLQLSNVLKELECQHSILTKVINKNAVFLK